MNEATVRDVIAALQQLDPDLPAMKVIAKEVYQRITITDLMTFKVSPIQGGAYFVDTEMIAGTEISFSAVVL
jgi:hypothetical protein